jgi:hypothetical protein
MHNSFLAMKFLWGANVGNHTLNENKNNTSSSCLWTLFFTTFNLVLTSQNINLSLTKFKLKLVVRLLKNVFITQFYWLYLIPHFEECSLIINYYFLSCGFNLWKCEWTFLILINYLLVVRHKINTFLAPLFESLPLAPWKTSKGCHNLVITPLTSFIPILG